MSGDPLLIDSTWACQTLMGPRARIVDTYGLKQEELLLQLLEQSGQLAVCHSRELDVTHKLDCVVLQRGRPSLPAVGVQFTTKQSVQKQALTLNAVARSAIVRRLLYVEAGCPVDDDVAACVVGLIKHAATRGERAAAVFTRVEKDSHGHVVAKVLRQVQIRDNHHTNVM